MSEMSREHLLQVVREVYDERDPVPAGLVERMQAAVAAEVAGVGLDLELMLLVEGERAFESVRTAGPETGSTAAYTLRFVLGEVELLVRVAPGDQARIDGWMVPPEPMTVRAVVGDGPARGTVVGESGRFEFTDLPAGLVRLRFEPHDPARPTFATPTFEI